MPYTRTRVSDNQAGFPGINPASFGSFGDVIGSNLGNVLGGQGGSFNVGNLLGGQGGGIQSLGNMLGGQGGISSIGNILGGQGGIPNIGNLLGGQGGIPNLRNLLGGQGKPGFNIPSDIKGTYRYLNRILRGGQQGFTPFHPATTVFNMIDRLSGDAAVARITELMERRRELHDNCQILQWLTNYQVSCYLYVEDGRVLSFALLSDFDPGPDCCHTEPRVLNYIYTVEAQRCRGLASALVRTIRDENQVTVVCTNDIAERIFYRAGYVIRDIVNGNAIYTYP